MLSKENLEVFNMKGIQIIDSAINADDTMIRGNPSNVVQPDHFLPFDNIAPSVMALNHLRAVFSLNESFIANISQRYEACGYAEFMENALKFPPSSPIAAPNPGVGECDMWTDIVSAAFYVIPCFNICHLTDSCPYLWDVISFPSLGGGANGYFNSAVQKAIHAPSTNYLVQRRI
jgi:carboxypeptidase D